MPDYYFDTTVLVAYFKNEDTRTSAYVDAVIRGEATAAVSAVTVAEVWAESAMEGLMIRRQRLALLALLEIVSVDRQIAQHGGLLRRKHGLKIPDALIAACCYRVDGYFLAKDSHFNRLLNAGVLSGEVYS